MRCLKYSITFFVGTVGDTGSQGRVHREFALVRKQSALLSVWACPWGTLGVRSIWGPLHVRAPASTQQFHCFGMFPTDAYKSAPSLWAYTFERKYISQGTEWGQWFGLVSMRIRSWQLQRLWDEKLGLEFLFWMWRKSIFFEMHICPIQWWQLHFQLYSFSYKTT